MHVANDDVIVNDEEGREQLNGEVDEDDVIVIDDNGGYQPNGQAEDADVIIVVDSGGQQPNGQQPDGQQPRADVIVIDDDEEQHLERPKCVICWEDLLSRDPRLLPCSHVICFTCLRKWFRSYEGCSECPICRKEVSRRRCKRMYFL